jgi:hypothetical protein
MFHGWVIRRTGEAAFFNFHRLVSNPWGHPQPSSMYRWFFHEETHPLWYPLMVVSFFEKEKIPDEMLLKQQQRFLKQQNKQ